MEKEQFLIPLNFDDVHAGEDMVAAGLYVDGGEPTHAAIIIRHNNQTRVFHFFKKVLLEEAEDERSEGRFAFIKKLDIIPSFLIPSFIAHCELIGREAKPKYGFFYDARSFYDASGKFQNPGSFPEYMTCVGFCLTVIQSYMLDEQYLYYDDWDHTTYDLDPRIVAYQMMQIQNNHPDLKPEELKKAVRRILPIEYFGGAFGDERPVRKAFTDLILPTLLTEIRSAVA